MSLSKILALAIPTTLAGYLYVKGTRSQKPVKTVETLDDVYDYIIVGAGSAGSVLASRLAEDKKYSVLLLEAGGSYDENPLMHIPLFSGAFFSTKYDWGYKTVPQKSSCQGLKDGRSCWPRGCVIGGTSILNGLMYTRGSRHDFDNWEASGCVGWSYKDVLPYFLKSEDVQESDLKNSLYHSSGGPLAVSCPSVTKLADIYLKAGQEMGCDVVDYNGETMSGFSKIQLNIRDGVRCSTGLAFLGGKELSNLHVATDSYVTKVELENKTATGVHLIRGMQKQFVKARREVILAGGAINSPVLLMLSGIGPRKHLKELGIPLVADLPVGENLQDHLTVPMFSAVNQPVGFTSDTVSSLWTNIQYVLFNSGLKSFTGLEGTAFFHLDSATIKSAKPDIQFVLYSGFNDANFCNFNSQVAKEYLAKSPNENGFSTVVIATQPHSRGTVRLQSSDSFDEPLLDPQYLSDKRDVQMLIKGVRLWEKYIQTPTMKELGVNIEQVNLSVCSEHEFGSDAYWECFIRHVGITGHHQCGTCKMGADGDRTAVVNPELKVRGILGLRVVDASIFPRITSGNTNAPVIMVAEKAADIILGRSTVEHLKHNV